MNCRYCKKTNCEGTCVESTILTRNVVVRNSVPAVNYQIEGEIDENGCQSISVCDLVRPSADLQAILKNIVKKYSISSLDLKIEFDGRIMVFIAGDQTTKVNISNIVEQTIINGIQVTDSSIVFSFGDTITTINFADLVQDNQTVTTLVDNEDGTYTYTSEDGTVTIINTNIGTKYTIKSSFENNELELLVPNI